MNKKEGVSVKEIGEFTQKHRFEVFFCVAFALACLFSFVFWGPGWGVLLAAIGGIIGVLIPGKVEHLAKTVLHFIFKQERTVQIVLGVVGWILAIFIPPLVFLCIGLHGGKSAHHLACEIHSRHK